MVNGDTCPHSHRDVLHASTNRRCNYRFLGPGICGYTGCGPVVARSGDMAERRNPRAWDSTSSLGCCTGAWMGAPTLVCWSPKPFMETERFGHREIMRVHQFVHNLVF